MFMLLDPIYIPLSKPEDNIYSKNFPAQDQTDLLMLVFYHIYTEDSAESELRTLNPQ